MSDDPQTPTQCVVILLGLSLTQKFLKAKKSSFQITQSHTKRHVLGFLIKKQTNKSKNKANELKSVFTLISRCFICLYRPFDKQKYYILVSEPQLIF